MSARDLSLLLSLLLATGCGFPPPPPLPENPGGPPEDARPPLADAVGDAPPGDTPADSTLPDAPDPPGTVLQVSPTGDDANDGLNQPVRTLKRALGLAAANSEIRTILIATGRYNAAAGEAFPYTVPANVTVAGPVTGGAVLVGTGVEPGVFVDTGKLRDLQLEQFTVAITGRGVTEISNVRVLSSGIAVRGVAASKLQVNGLDVDGAAGACAIGVELNGDAELTVDDFSSRALGISFHLKDQSVTTVSNANITGDKACNQSSLGVFTVATSKTLALRDSLINGGHYAIRLVSAAAPPTVTVTNATLRNMDIAIVGKNVVFQMTGGELSSNGTAVGTDGGDWRFTGVTVKQNQGFSFEIGNGGTFAMRNCSNVNNTGGVYLVGNSMLDLGTASDPGNNIFNNTFQGANTHFLEVESGCASIINAVGNTWHPNTQGSNGAGQYSSQRITGPSLGENFRIPAPCMLQL